MDNLFSWAILSLALIFAAYAAFIIKDEKNVAVENGVGLEFHGFKFIIPRWWSITSENENKIVFERTDTRYDWKATFNFLNDNHADLQEVFETMALKRKLVFDKDTSIVHSPSMLKELESEGINGLRVEGTATQDEQERVYYDAFVIQCKNGGYLYLESRSSILNGLLEGPFFEQAISNIKKASD